MQINLSGLDIGMSKLLGYGIDIDSTRDKKGSIGMTEAMERYLLRDASVFQPSL